MRFAMRSLSGLILLLLAAGFVVLGALRLGEALREADATPPARSAQPERVYTVEVLIPQPQDVWPELTAYGEVVADRRLELRPALAGRLSELSPAFRDGGAVRAGELLFRLDPADAESALDHARIALEETKADREAAGRTLALAGQDLAAATERLRLQAQALDRQKDLLTRLVGSAASVETAELNRAAAEQGRIDAEQALSAARTQDALTAIALERAALEVEDARRALAETEQRAPFDGLLTETSAVLGRQVAANEKLGALIDPGRLQAAVQVSSADYARLLDAAGGLRDLGAEVRLELGAGATAIPATLDRAAAATGDARTGRTLFLRLGAGAAELLREGDFVTARIREPMLADVAVVPAAAATEDGRVLVVDADDRLRERQVRILRRQGDRLVVGDAPFGERVVAIRKPQLGAGARARADLADAGALRAASAAATPQAPGAAAGPEAGAAPEMLSLTPERRAALRGRVEGAPDLQEDERARLLRLLSGDSAPRDLVERLERQGAGGAGAGGGMKGG